MENYAYSSYPESGDSSPRSREIECDPAVAVAVAAWDEQPPLSHPRVKLLCSYGGRIQPRAHDNQLSYVGGDTKILAVERSVRYSTIIGKLSALSGSDDVILKYQLPGEDLDSLISVTNDEDVEHMMIEYDRLHRSGSKPIPRLRLFLFAAMGKGSQDRASFADPPPAVTAVTAVTPRDGPDYLFGLEAAEVKDPGAEKAGIEVAPPRSEVEAAGPSPAELQMQLQELQRLQVAEKQQQLQQQQQQMNSMQRNGSDETLARAYPPADYYAPPPVQEKAPPAPSQAAPALTQAPPAAYWQDHHRSVAPPTRFSSFMGGDGNLYLVPTPGGYPANAVPGQTYYTTLQRMVPTQATATYDTSAAVYAAATPQQAKAPAAYETGGVRGQAAVEGSAGYAAPAVGQGAYDNGAGYAAGYDSNGRAVYYHQTVNSVAMGAESKVMKPSQVS